MNVMNFKDYSARIENSDEDGCFIGHIAGIRDVVGFWMVCVQAESGI